MNIEFCDLEHTLSITCPMAMKHVHLVVSVVVSIVVKLDYAQVARLEDSAARRV